MLEGDIEVGEGAAKLSEEKDEAFGAGNLALRGVVIDAVCGDDVANAFQMARDDRFSEFDLRL